MKKIVLIALCYLSFQSVSAELSLPLTQFSSLYQTRFGDVRDCSVADVYRICSSSLRNQEVAPVVLHHGKKTAKVAILFHGLSDSPYYLLPIAEHLHSLGLNVILPLLPAHGLQSQQQAKQQLLDYELSSKWRAHVKDVLALAKQFGDITIIGGFSTGGALSIDYTLHNSQNVQAVMLFSGALALSGNAESLSKIWGVPWLARWLDRNYNALGQNPFKYAGVPNSSGLELMEIIEDIRAKLARGANISQPLFVAHSASDVTTPIEGVIELLDYAKGQNTVFHIDESHKVCHADLVLNPESLVKMKTEKMTADPRNACAVPKANPVFDKIIALTSLFIAGI